MKIIRHLFSYGSLIFLAGAAVAVSAQVRPPVPRASQKATIAQTIGTTEISIAYSRPSVKGRLIFGEAPPAMAARAKGEATLDNQNERKAGEPIVPYDHLWRAGANEATLFTVTDDVLVNGQPLAAGKYSFHMIPAKDGNWTVVFNKDDGQWGSFTYDAAKDALRVKTKAETAASNMELLTYYFDPVAENQATVHLRWEKMDVPFTVQVKDVVGSTMNRLRAYVAAAKPDDAGPYISAASYAKSIKLNDEANKWFEEALKRNDAAIAAKETYQNLSRRSNILFQLGKTQDSLAAAEKAVAVGKSTSADTSAMEKRIADIKAGKQ
jgi:tetratricopeptide (TPR) repeat protein